MGKSRHRPILISAICIVLLALTSAIPQPAAAQERPLVLAMYYAWFDEHSWGPDKMADQPIETYRSAERATIERQVQQAQRAGIDGFELNWYGPNNPTDTNLQTLLSVANAHGFKATIDFDLNSPLMHAPADVTNALSYVKRYFDDPAWLRVNGKPVIVFYGIRRYDPGTWESIRRNVDPSHAALWIGEGDQFGYLSVFDGIHPYSIAWSPNPAGQLASYATRTRAIPGKLWMATVMPGYDDTRLGRPNGFRVERRAGAYYSAVWQGAIETRPDLISITSWNEWPEGSQIEPGQGYGDLYLTITRHMSDRFKSAPADQAGRPAPPNGGAFFTEAGAGQGGFAISNAQGMSFFDSFRAFGGVGALGYPSSQRFTKDGFTYQATQGALLQWRPEAGRVVLANTFEWFTDAGRDDWLDAVAAVPHPIRDDGSDGNWARAKQIRLGWLTDESIKRHYLAVGSLDRAIDLYGLPASPPERRGPFVIQRFQRIAFQHWIEEVPGMPAKGSVVRVLAGDYLKQAGLIPVAAARPASGP